MQGRCNQLIEDAVYPGLEAAIEDAIAAEELMPEEERFAPANENIEAGMEQEQLEGRGAGLGDRADPFRRQGLGRKSASERPRRERGGQFVAGSGH